MTSLAPSFNPYIVPAAIRESEADERNERLGRRSRPWTGWMVGYDSAARDNRVTGRRRRG